jgi:hypothetical protein
MINLDAVKISAEWASQRTAAVESGVSIPTESGSLAYAGR